MVCSNPVVSDYQRRQNPFSAKHLSSGSKVAGGIPVLPGCAAVVGLLLAGVASGWTSPNSHEPAFTPSLSHRMPGMSDKSRAGEGVGLKRDDSVSRHPGEKPGPGREQFNFEHGAFQAPSGPSPAAVSEVSRPAADSSPAVLHSTDKGGVPRPEAEAAALKKAAIGEAHHLAELYPKDALVYALLGAAYFNTGHADEATGFLRRCLELNPDEAEAYDILARVAYDRGDLEETARLCQEALRGDPANAETLNRLGRVRLDQGRAEDAIQILERAAGLPRPVSESFYLLGQAHLQAGQTAEAIRQFQRSVALEPDHTQAYFGLYTAFMREGHPDQAAPYRERFLKLEADDRKRLSDRSGSEDTLTGLPLVRRTAARIFLGAAQIYARHHDDGSSAEFLRKSAALDPDNPVPRAALEAHFVRRQALAEGVSAFEQLAAEQPANKLNYLHLARLQARLQHLEAAERAYRKVQELAPGWAEGYGALSEFYLRTHRNPAEALALARKANAMEPTAAHYYLLSAACVANDDRTGARHAMENAVRLSPDEPKYREGLEKLQR